MLLDMVLSSSTPTLLSLKDNVPPFQLSTPNPKAPSSFRTPTTVSVLLSFPSLHLSIDNKGSGIDDG